MQVDELLKPFPIKEFHPFPRALLGPGSHEMIGPEAPKIGFQKTLILPSGPRGPDIDHKLAAALKEAGIDYVHLKPLGTPKAGRDAGKKGDVATLTAVYAGQLDLPEAQAAAARMLALADEMPSALLCFERDPSHCHRTLLLRAAGEGRDVVDLFA